MLVAALAALLALLFLLRRLFPRFTTSPSLSSHPRSTSPKPISAATDSLPGLYCCRTRHVRSTPVRHAFDYPVFYVGVKYAREAKGFRPMTHGLSPRIFQLYPFHRESTL